MAQLLPFLLSVVLLVHPAWADGPAPLQQDQYFCEGDPLLAQVFAGAVDAPGIPPGAYVVLQWRGVSLQLPRTNNAGTPSYTDGRWWWRAEDLAHPEFRQRRGDTITYSCQWQSGPWPRPIASEARRPPST
jgi:hypothetical protein